MRLVVDHELVATIKKLAETDGLSCNQIAQEINRSRNSTMGLIWRHKIRLKRKSGQSADIERKPFPRTRQRNKQIKPPNPSVLMPLKAPDPAKHVNLLGLSLTMCPWPMGEVYAPPPYLYCGCEKDITDQYCAYHAHKSKRWDYVKAPKQSVGVARSLHHMGSDYRNLDGYERAPGLLERSRGQDQRTAGADRAQHNKARRGTPQTQTRYR